MSGSASDDRLRTGNAVSTKESHRPRLVWLLVCLLLLATTGSPAGAISIASPEEKYGWREWPLQKPESAGQFREALSEARNLLRSAEESPERAAWRIADAKRDITRLERILDLPKGAQQELKAAYQQEAEVRRLLLAHEYAAATAAIEQQIQVFAQHLGPWHLEVAIRLKTQADCLLGVGDHAQAEALCRESLQLHREVLGRQHPLYALALVSMADILFAQGHLSGAEVRFREVLTLYREIYHEEHFFVTDAMAMLAAVYGVQGRFSEAEPLMYRALAMRRRMPKEQQGRVEQSLHQLAWFLLIQSKPAAAEPLLWELLARRRARLCESHYAIGRNLIILGAALEELGDLDRAEQILREAVDFHREQRGAEHLEVAKSLAFLAPVLQSKGDLSGAEELLHEALTLFKRHLDEPHPLIAGALSKLASVQMDQGRLEEAEGHYRLAHQMLCEFPSGGDLVRARSQDRLAQCLLRRGKFQEAERILLEAAAAYERARLTAGVRFSEATFRARPCVQLAALRLLGGRGDEAWPAAERALDRSTGDLLLTTDQRFLSPGEAARRDSLRREVGRLDDLFAALQRRELEGGAGGDFLATQVAETEIALLEVRLGLSDFQRELALKYPVIEGQVFPLERIQAVLPAETAIIGWVFAPLGEEDRAWGYVIQGSGEVFWAPLPQPAHGPPLGACARAFRAELDSVASWPVYRMSVAGIHQRGLELWERCFAPLRPYLQGIAQLVVLPSGPMLGMPVEAFVDSAGAYLGDRYEISYAPSATIYAWLREHGGGRQATRTRHGLLLGDPPFNLEQLEQMNTERTASGASPEESDERSALEQLFGIFREAKVWDAAALGKLPRLSGTREEVEHVAAAFEQARILLGAEASEQELVRLADTDSLREFDTIHLATHALIDNECPERSALVLARTELSDPLRAAIDSTRFYDGLLTAKEIVREWELDADLVTLSACQTAMGKQSEGYIGMAQAFLQVGARSLLVSLWKVDDTATRLLMGKFYACLKEIRRDPRGRYTAEAMAKAEALSRAKRWLRSYEDPEGRQLFRHPAYWSAFVLIGDPR